MKKIRLFWLVLLAIIPAAQGVFAAGITNLDTIPYDLHVNIGGQVEEIHIEPGATWTHNGYDVRVRYRGKWMPLNFASNYAIWEGGALAEQSKGPRMRGAGR